MELLHGKLDIRFLRIPTTSSSAIWSQIPCGLFSSPEYHFFSEPGPMNDHCPVPNLLAYMDTTRACARQSSSLSCVPQEMSLNIDINRILPVTFSGVCRNLQSKSLTLSQSCNVSNPGKMFHSNSVGSPLISVKVAVALRRKNPIYPFPPSFVRFKILMDLPKTQHRIWKDVDFCALKIDDCFVTN